MSESTEVKILIDIGDIKGDIGEIKGTLAAINDRHKQTMDALKAHNTRLQVLEDERQQAQGIIKAVKFIGPSSLFLLAVTAIKAFLWR